MGIAKDGSRKESFQHGVALKGRATLLTEGCRGSLSKKVMKKFKLREKIGAQHQTYALGIKEVWETEEGKHEPGTVLHTLGCPLDYKTYGGSFLYHMEDRQIAIGLLVALNYHNPFLNPYEEFQKLKHHPVSSHYWKGIQVAKLHSRILYPKPDGVLSFDIPTSLHRSNTNHDHDQPAHLHLRNPKIPELVNLAEYGALESRYCPARVYESLPDEEGGQLKLQINAQNCLRYKACDIKDPKQNIEWTVPEGGGGPGYSVM